MEIKDIWQLVEGCPGSRGRLGVEIARDLGPRQERETSIHAAMNDKPPPPKNVGKSRFSPGENSSPFASFYSRSSKKKKKHRLNFVQIILQLQFRGSIVIDCKKKKLRLKIILDRFARIGQNTKVK